MTPAGMWREANIAIRAKPGIAMEILRQLPTLSTEHAQIVDAEMGVGANAPEADAALEAGWPGAADRSPEAGHAPRDPRDPPRAGARDSSSA